jgi:hypothetical protein
MAMTLKRAAVDFFLRQVRRSRRVLRSPRMKNSILLFIIALFTVVSSPLAAAPWTDFPLASGARAVYVSSSEGNDANDGLTLATPKRTMAGTPSPTPNNPNNVLPGGFAVVRSGMGDQLLLKRGDTFSETRPFVWNKSGLSPAYPAVLGAYGSGPRPLIDRGAEIGLQISPVTGPTVRDVAVTGIHFRAGIRDWNSSNFQHVQGRPAIFMAAGSNPAYPIVDGVLIEDCRIEFTTGGVSMVGAQLGSIRNIRLNRNVLTDIYAVDHAHTNGVYASNVTGLTLTENLIDGVQRTASRVEYRRSRTRRSPTASTCSRTAATSCWNGTSWPMHSTAA